MSTYRLARTITDLRMQRLNECLIQVLQGAGLGAMIAGIAIAAVLLN